MAITIISVHIPYHWRRVTVWKTDEKYFKHWHNYYQIYFPRGSFSTTSHTKRYKIWTTWLQWIDEYVMDIFIFHHISLVWSNQYKSYYILVESGFQNIKIACTCRVCCLYFLIKHSEMKIKYVTVLLNKLWWKFYLCNEFMQCMGISFFVFSLKLYLK